MQIRRIQTLHAIGKNHLETLRASIESPALDPHPEELSRALLTASMIGDAGAVCALIDRGADVNSKDSGARTPLIEAAFGGHIDTMRLLLTRGAQVNAGDADGWTALMEAASKGRTDMVRLLLDNGAIAAAMTRSGWTALRIAVKRHAPIAAMLRGCGGPLQ